MARATQDGARGRLEQLATRRTGNHDTLHEWCPVLRGRKFIITKWFRETRFEHLAREGSKSHHTTCRNHKVDTDSLVVPIVMIWLELSIVLVVV